MRLRNGFEASFALKLAREDWAPLHVRTLGPLAVELYHDANRAEARCVLLERRLAWALDRLDKIRADGMPTIGGCWSRRALARLAKRAP